MKRLLSRKIAVTADTESDNGNRYIIREVWSRPDGTKVIGYFSKYNQWSLDPTTRNVLKFPRSTAYYKVKKFNEENTDPELSFDVKPWKYYADDEYVDVKAKKGTYKVIRKSQMLSIDGFWHPKDPIVCFTGSFEECSAWLEDKYIECKNEPAGRIWVNDYIPEEELSIDIIGAETVAVFTISK